MPGLTSGIAIASAVTLVGSIVGMLASSRLRRGYWEKFGKREHELMRRWRNDGNPESVLTYPTSVKRSVAFMVGIWLSLLALVSSLSLSGDLSSGNGATYDPFVFIGVVILMGVAPGMLAMETFGSDCTVTQSGVITGGGLTFRRATSISWDEIQSVSYDELKKSYIIRAKGDEIRVRALLQGIGIFLLATSIRVPKERNPTAFHPINRRILEGFQGAATFMGGSQ